MNAETFFKKLDAIRSEARQKFGMKHESINFLSESVQNLIKLVDEIHDEIINKAVTPTAPPPPSIDHLAGLEPSVAPEGAMTLEKLPRDPRPVHPIEVVEATENTVVAPDGGWQDGDS